MTAGRPRKATNGDLPRHIKRRHVEGGELYYFIRRNGRQMPIGPTPPTDGEYAMMLLTDGRLELLEPQHVAELAKPFELQYSVYFLVLNGDVIYAGVSENVNRRLSQHRAKRTFDQVFILNCDKPTALKLEARYIEKFRPALNVRPNRNRILDGEGGILDGTPKPLRK